MKVTRGQILARGFAGQCPNCGGRTLFSPGARFRLNERCGACGVKLDRGEGFFLGPFVINYTVTVVFVIVPVILLNVVGVLGSVTAFMGAAVAAVGIPILLYRRSWSWWLMAYFYFLPHKLPANQDEPHEAGEE